MGFKPKYFFFILIISFETFFHYNSKYTTNYQSKTNLIEFKGATNNDTVKCNSDILYIKWKEKMKIIANIFTNTEIRKEKTTY